MNKLSLTDRPLSPDEKRHYGYLTGKGLYSALALKNIVFHSQPDDDDDDLRKIVVKLPKERLQRTKQADSLTDFIGPLVSGNRGFREKQEQYMSKQKEHLKNQLSEAEQEYLNHLMNSKKAELASVETPHVDAFCLGMLKEIEKNADENHISHGALGRALRDIARPVTKHLPSKQALKDKFLTIPTLAAGGMLYSAKSMLRGEQPRHEKRPLDIQVEAI